MSAISEIVERVANGVAVIECPDMGSRGSGFLVSPDGLVVTNAHVVAKPTITTGGFLSVQYSSDIKVRIAGSVQSAQLVTDPDEPRPIVYDYALLRVDPVPEVDPLQVSDAGAVSAGEQVVCLGYPLDFEAVVATHGIVSSVIHRPSHWNALHRIRTIVTDALIQFGNSGGPMVQVETGLVVGINTFKHPVRDALTQRLTEWLENPAISGVPAMEHLIQYTLRFTHIGLNHAVSTEFVTEDPAWTA